jgi:hypothetical protein
MDQAIYLRDKKTPIRLLIRELDPAIPMEADILAVLKQYDLEFLCQLQRLHDNINNWDEDGLSKIGRLFANEIEYRLDELFNN